MSIIAYINAHKQDAIFWQSNQWLAAAAQDPYKMAHAYSDIAGIIALIPDMMVRKQYSDMLPSHKALKEYKINKKKLSLAIADAEELNADIASPEDDNAKRKLPPWMNREQLEMRGFCDVQTDSIVGYYNQGQGGGANEITNFLMNPIFHVRGDSDSSRHIFEVSNRLKTVLMDLPSKALVSLETLQNALVAEGNFIFFGSKAHLLLISREILDHFPECFEVKNLGWQQEGFFAWVNKAYIPGEGFVDIDEWGIIKHKKESYLIPAASKAYNSRRSADDPFKLIRPLSYRPSDKVSFATWGQQMQKVYGERGIVGIAYVFLSLFRDVVFKLNHNAPHLYGYGERSSGKSAWANSITAIFYNGRDAFNLNSGTDFAFFHYMQSFRNCPAQLNEFDDKTVKDEWFQAIKGIFDGESRMRGKMGNRNGIEVQEVESSLILTGQYISTKDDNSVVSRSIVVPFAENNITEATKIEYTKLDQMQKEGLTHLLADLLPLRKQIEDEYYNTFNEQIKLWRKSTTNQFNQRIFNNWCHLASLWHIVSKHINLPISDIEFSQLAYDEAIKYSKFIRNSDVLSEFWNTVAFLLDQQQISEGWDFRIKMVDSIKLRNGDGKEYEQKFAPSKKVLIIRLNNVVPLYQQAYRSRNGEKAMSMQNLQHYFSNREYYIGQVKNQRFNRYVYKAVEEVIPGTHLAAERTEAHNKQAKETAITSAFIFDYELLECDLDRGGFVVSEEEDQEIEKLF